MLRYQISRPDPARLQSEVDEFMLKFKTSEYEKEREKLERLSKMDEDGFVVVTRHKKGRATDGTIAVSVASNAIDPTKLKKKELVDFYRFQMRERKKNGKQHSSLCICLLLTLDGTRTCGITETVRRGQGQDCKTEGKQTLQAVLIIIALDAYYY